MESIDNDINPISEIFSLILGGLGLLMLVSSLNTLIRSTGTGFDDVSAILGVFLHLILILIALPLMLKSMSRDKILDWYRMNIVFTSALNSLLIIIILFFLSKNGASIVATVVFIIIALIELLPIYLIKYKYNSQSSSIQV